MINKLHKHTQKITRFVFQNGGPDMPGSAERPEELPSKPEDAETLPTDPNQQPSEAADAAGRMLGAAAERLSFGNNIDVENPPPDDAPNVREYDEEYNKRAELAKEVVNTLENIRSGISEVKSVENSQPPVNPVLDKYATEFKITKRGNNGEAYLTDSWEGAESRPARYTSANLDNIENQLKSWAQKNKNEENKGDIGIAIMRMVNDYNFKKLQSDLNTLNSDIDKVKGSLKSK